MGPGRIASCVHQNAAGMKPCGCAGVCHDGPKEARLAQFQGRDGVLGLPRLRRTTAIHSGGAEGLREALLPQELPKLGRRVGDVDDDTILNWYT